MKNAEPAGIGSFLVPVLYSDILRGLADTSCPSSAKRIVCNVKNVSSDIELK